MPYFMLGHSNFRHIRFSAIMALMSLFIYSDRSVAKMRVIVSNTSHYKVGQELSDDDPLDLLGPGCRITVLKLPSNETAIVEGSKDFQPPVGGAREIPNLPCANH
jgi:hypothetical protein